MNRLTAASKTGASANFWYDGYNRVCTWQVNGSTNARFNVWDGWILVAEYKAGMCWRPSICMARGAMS